MNWFYFLKSGFKMLTLCCKLKSYVKIPRGKKTTTKR